VPKKERFNQEEFEVVPKEKGLAKRYKFNQEELEVVPKKKGLPRYIMLTKKSSKLCQKAKI
jgi:hypothetical protein